MKTADRLRSTTRPLWAALLVASAALLAGGSPALAAGKLVEKLVDVPREARVPVDITYEKGTLLWVESQNDPKAKDVDEAKAVDPDDKTFVVLRFVYKNDDYYSHKVKLQVFLLDDEGGVLAEGGRSATLDKMEAEDTVTFPIKVKTLDWPRATKLRVLATFKR
ncbi:MAG: hypothetical protein EDX89_17485 [Acidobacteria bacterium]|nr:MAG: hypothetical protein EDX89_17485 [Acidobacteriota bacterium]MCE7959791.1 hypothetical protein [Acidobacteria bacterium ACB2]